ncbi:MAG TPA: hypothetical protein VEK07_16100 [Polyangiaceae bacterium]|nr:hypothetical protein [Polyangiaceae bacterium]
MATRSEQQHAEQERRGPTPRARKRAAARKSRREKFGTSHATEHAGTKASYALERPSREGKASRKSSRASANRAKADTNFNLREEMVKGSPQSRSAKARAKSATVRGRRSGP